MKKDDTSRLIAEYLKKGGKITRCKPKLPKDALAISSWCNEDEAWVDVVGGIKKHIKLFESQKKIAQRMYLLSKQQV